MKISIKARFSDAILFEGEYESTRHAAEAAVKSGINLRGADLRGASLYGANLRGADLRGADLRSASLRGASLYGASLYGADLRSADLRGADLRSASLYGANLRGADLYGANLYGADLYGANLYGADGEKITTIKSVLQVGPVGSRKDYTVAIGTDKGIYVNAGCFFGTFVEFKAKVKDSHKNGQFAAEYKAVIAMINAVFKARKV